MKKLLISTLVLLLFAIQGYANDSTYLNFTAVGGPATVSLCNTSFQSDISLEYSTDSCATWNAYTLCSVISLAEDSTVFFKATTTNDRFSTGTDRFHTFSMTGKVSADGNIMSLLDSSMQVDSVLNQAFYNLFNNCNSLIKAPALPANKLGYRCYNQMFCACKSLKEAPALPATTLSWGCYEGMFSQCTSLIRIPNLPATNVANRCYKEMFRGCTALHVDTAPPGVEWQLQVAVASNSPWDNMFGGTGGTFKGTPVNGKTYYVSSDNYDVSVILNDTSMGYIAGAGRHFLGDTVTLTAVANPGYVFSHWGNGDTIHTISFVMTSDTLMTAEFSRDSTMCFVTVNTSDPLKGTTTSSGGVYRLMDSLTVTAIPNISYLFDRWSTGDTMPTITIQIDRDTVLTAYFVSDLEFQRANYLNFTAVGNSATVKLKNRFYNPVVAVQISTDDCVTWHDYTVGNLIQLMNAGDKVYFKAKTKNATFCQDYDVTTYQFETTTSGNGTISVGGDVMSLMDATMQLDTLPRYAFAYLFMGCNITNTPRMSAKRLSKYSYYCMFKNCTNLTTIADMPITSVGEKSCYGMFEGCTSLHVDTAPTGYPWQVSPDTTGIVQWNNNMFANTAGTFTGNPAKGTTYYISSYQCRLMSSTSDPTMGIVSAIDGWYNYMDTVTLTATPNPGYQLDGWSNGDTSMVISFLIVKDTVLRANFSRNPSMHFVTLEGDKRWGYGVGAGAYTHLDSVAITAVPYPGFIFTNWSTGDTSVITTIQVVSDTTVTAYFKMDTAYMRRHTLNFTAVGGPAAMNMIAGYGSYATHYMYSTDNYVTWDTLNLYDVITLNEGEKVYLRAADRNSRLGNGWDNERIVMSGKIYADGNVMSLIDYRLNVNSVGEGGLAMLFYNCKSLIHAPELPAKSLSKYCYRKMFYGCTSLTAMPELPATSVSDCSYEEMFAKCTSLVIDSTASPSTVAWQIPAQATVRGNWNKNMFSQTGGTFTGNPQVGVTYYVLPTTLKITANVNDSTMGYVEGGGMYVLGDTVTLTAVPKPGYDFVVWDDGDTARVKTFIADSYITYTANFRRDTTMFLVRLTVNNPTMGYATCNGAYHYMDTATITAVPYAGVLFDRWSNGDTSSMASVVIDRDTMFIAYFKADTAFQNLRTLHFTAVNSPATIQLTKVGMPDSVVLECSNDACATWNNYPTGSVMTLSSGETVYLRATTANATFSKSANDYYNFVMTGNVSAEGSIMALLDALSDTVPEYAFCYLFDGCTSLVKAPELPAMNLSAHCYEGMFSGCTSLAYVPYLPATGLAPYCYQDMFGNCSNLRINNGINNIRQMAILSGKPWSIPADANPAMDWNKNMLANTGGSFTGDPEMGVIYNLDYMRKVSALIDDSCMGTVAGCGYNICLDTVVLTAKPNVGYLFTNWGNGDTSRTITFVVTTDTLLTVYFEVDPTYSSVVTAEEDMDFTLIPNPVHAGECAYISNSNGRVVVEIFAMNGTCVRRFESSETSIAIDEISEPGAYLICLTTIDGKHSVLKLIVD